VAGLILMLLTGVMVGALYSRVDMGEYIRQKMEQSSRSQQQSEEQKEMGVRIGKIAGMVIPPVAVPIMIAAGAALYLLGVMAFGGSMRYMQALSVWTYSSLPPTLLGIIVGILVLFLKSAETIDPEHLLVTNPGAFMNAQESPVLAAFFSQFDLLRFYGMFLAAIGLRKMAKLSSGSAGGIVIGLWLIGLVLSVAWKAIAG
jgi:Yip1 domain